MKRLSFISALVTVLFPVALGAQSQRTAAALSLIEGAVYLNDQPITLTAESSALPDAAVIRTADGRAAVALKHGGWLFLDRGASVRVFANRVYNFNRIEVMTGSAIVVSATSAPTVQCESDIRLSTAGIFRFDAQPVNANGERPCAFRVFEGAAAVPLASLTVAMRAGQTMKCNRRCGDMIPMNEFSPEQLDDFDKWARQAQVRLSTSVVVELREGHQER